MKGIISKTLAIKDLYDNMAEDLRPYFFRSASGYWLHRGWTMDQTEADEKIHVIMDIRSDDWFLLYGEDDRYSCELDFREDEKTGKLVPYEYTVWNGRYGDRTYHRVF